ncbi:LLM class flavin-dependent oxidoreductase [Rhizobium sp. CF142]|uniref:LLM class flavin-dependent oxidoreductase n=1 Tax=Rhizobium sp. CF142 TaxID=1144314 RepID=UPI00026EEC21|nr:LLM class flavin-dependent oxidoreductase [Rhizobium sp. CF142]EJJ26700.1 flavin-dependent oxidoreductase, methylene-tetrahydromethanopterin reductase [Rhizobium sp. CF142]
MQVYHFSENPYPQAWDADERSLRITLPSKHFDPKIGADLLNRYIDEWALCDELGLNIWVNEHHSTATCLTTSTMLPLAMLARETKRARLLTLGVPIGVRHDPVMAAEEAAYVDVVSRGRLELGLVKGYPTEIAPANVNPAQISERFWEAHDLIIKALTSHDGDFNWEGNHFHYRHVNIWPRPYQRSGPPVWITGFTPHSAGPIADRGHVIAAGLNARNGRNIYNTYRKRRAERGHGMPDLDRFGYMVLVGVGDSEEEGHRFARQVKGYLDTTGIVHPAFGNPPGYYPVAARVGEVRRGQQGVTGSAFQTDRAGDPVSYATASIEKMIEVGAVFAGTPDQVFEQIKELYDYVGGFGNLLAMMQGGALSHADTTKSMRLFSTEVLPRLAELKAANGREDEDFERMRRTVAIG